MLTKDVVKGSKDFYQTRKLGAKILSQRFTKKGPVLNLYKVQSLKFRGKIIDRIALLLIPLLHQKFHYLYHFIF